jgi:hypothetical protein
VCVFFGWQHGTKVVRRYIHLSGKDVDNVLLSLNEGGEQIKAEEYKLELNLQEVFRTYKHRNELLL